MSLSWVLSHRQQNKLDKKDALRQFKTPYCYQSFSMDSRMGIARFPQEILYGVFEHLLDGKSRLTLLNCALCCKAWYPLAQTVLYRYIVLTYLTLPLFIRRRSSISADANKSIRVLTLRLDPAKLNQPTILLLLKDFAVYHLKDMNQLISLSIYQIPAPNVCDGFAIPTNGLAYILENLPQSCIGLEIESIKFHRHRNDQESYMKDNPEDEVHLCPYIREVLPQLQYFRLRLNTLCPDLFGTNYLYDLKSSFTRVEETYKVINLPHLKECVINLARKRGHMAGPYGPPNSVLCHDPAGIQPCLPIIATHMQRLLQKNEETKDASFGSLLQKLWVIDFQPNLQEPTNQNYYAAFVRRDIVTQTSLALPHRDIWVGEPDTWHLRQPVSVRGSESNNEKLAWEDVVGFPWAIEQLTEGPAWVDLESPIPDLRLASPLFKSKGSCFIPAVLPVVSRNKWFFERKRTSTLWVNEDTVGQKLIEPSQKGLLAQHDDLNMRIPKGWRLQSGEGSYLERIE